MPVCSMAGSNHMVGEASLGRGAYVPARALQLRLRALIMIAEVAVGAREFE